MMTRRPAADPLYLTDAEIAELPRMVSPRQIANCKSVGLSEGEVRRVMDSGRLPSEPVGKRRKVRKVDLIRYLSEPREKPCLEGTPVPAFGSSNGASVSTFAGPKEDAIASAALALISGRKLKSSSRHSSKAERENPARVIRGRF